MPVAHALKFSPDARQLVCACADRTLQVRLTHFGTVCNSEQVLDLEAGTLTAAVEIPAGKGSVVDCRAHNKSGDHPTTTTRLCISADGQWAAVMFGPVIHIVNLDNAQVIRILAWYLH